ncbi:VF530 family DNA-binding protein [Shewanella sp. JM162201]|uniref:VF530 family DNA-binding protein n=1 Tax=Shewanella jiangmenensis TaxID=2837387 RepID=A0ABS5UYH4_9GAMM|nr:VF530 family protein [Shewanella jiangmenensis]MBT1443145.1 VF530 family DNA-binding protein [Shewanella jiangmenensis]
MSSQPNNPLHGLTLKAMLEHLVDTLGWPVLADKIRIRCFAVDPSLDSSLKFLRRTSWARTKLELLYLTEQGFSVPELKDKADKADKRDERVSKDRKSPQTRTDTGNANRSGNTNRGGNVWRSEKTDDKRHEGAAEKRSDKKCNKRGDWPSDKHSEHASEKRANRPSDRPSDRRNDRASDKRGSKHPASAPHQSREPARLKGQTLTLKKPEDRNINTVKADKADRADNSANANIWGKPKGEAE